MKGGNKLMKIIKRMFFVGLVALALLPLLYGLAGTCKASGPKPDIDVEPSDDSGVGLLSFHPANTSNE